MQITKLDLPRCSVGEGPVWDVAEQALYYIDILEKKVFRWDPANADHRAWAVPDIIGSMALREEGGAVLALGDGIHTLDFDSGETAPLALLDPANAQVQLADGEQRHVEEGTRQPVDAERGRGPAGRQADQHRDVAEAEQEQRERPGQRVVTATVPPLPAQLACERPRHGDGDEGEDGIHGTREGTRRPRVTAIPG